MSEFSSDSESDYKVKERVFSVGDMVTYKPYGEYKKIYWKRGKVIEILTGADKGMYLVRFNLYSINPGQLGKVGWESLW